MDIDGIEAYGRNGGFWLKEIEVRQGRYGLVVSFFSKIRRRKRWGSTEAHPTLPPIQLAGNKEDLIKLFQGIVKQLKKL